MITLLERIKMHKIMLATAALALIISSSAMAGDVAAGKTKSMMCVACHGMKGISAIGIYPNLAGQKEQYLVKQIKAFRSGDRIDPSMKPMVASLTDTDVDNLAAYFSSLK